MDSEDDLRLLDDDEDYYDGDAMDSDIDNFDEGDIDDSGTSSGEKAKNYTVLKGDDIRRRQEGDIAMISSVLSISRDTAYVLLSRHGWSADKVEEEWFADEDRVRTAAGVFDKPIFILPEGKHVECLICFDSYRADVMKGASCGHLFCETCWTGYITTSINDGPGCLNLRCPAINPACGAAVGVDMVDMFASEEDRARYRRYLLRSYIEESKSTKWCPAPGCECAVEIELGSGRYDVSCDCSYRFCWNCTEETHRPVDCETVSKWKLKNTSEAENTNWILANSKPCPKCKKAIEKNYGCMHMTCRPPCRHEFCWLCLGPWKEHGSNYYTCNRYEAAKGEKEFSEAEKRRELAKISIEKYTHFYERWRANHLSRAKAMADLEQMRIVNLEKLSVNQCTTITMLQFVIDAWVQIVECRRVLKWTYAYGYYLPEEEHAKVQLFEYLQGEAEAGLERLHQCAETELQDFLEESGRGDEFHDFRIKLTGLTKTTHGYFENLVSALENGLSGVDSSSGTRKKMNKVRRKKWSETFRAARGNLDEQDAVAWVCGNCGQTNDWSETRCRMCGDESESD